MWKEVIVAYFMVLLQHLCRNNESQKLSVRITGIRTEI
jgi:hypothetical protein